MENNIPPVGEQPQGTPSAGESVPPPVQQQAAPYTPPVSAPPSTYGDGGSAGKGNVLSRFFEGVTLTDVVITTLSLLSFAFIIKHYGARVKQIKEERESMKQLNELSLNVKEVMGENYISLS